MNAVFKPASPAVSVPTMDGLCGETSNLVHLMDTACLAMGELDYGTGATRNHDLDRANALVQVGRDLAEKIEGMATAVYPTTLASARREPASPFKYDLDAFTILDLEIAVDGLLRLEHGASGVYSQPRALCSKQANYVPGAAFLRDFVENVVDREIGRILQHLKTMTFDDAEDECRRDWLIIKIHSEYVDPEVSVSDILAEVGSVRRSAA